MFPGSAGFKSGLRQTETAQSNKSWLKAPTDFARSTCRGNAERLGGKLQLFYTMGEYDLARILEMPDDEAEMQFALETGSLGNVRTKTLTQ